jgi:hypothetical protein
MICWITFDDLYIVGEWKDGWMIDAFLLGGYILHLHDDGVTGWCIKKIHYITIQGDLRILIRTID